MFVFRQGRDIHIESVMVPIPVNHLAGVIVRNMGSRYICMPAICRGDVGCTDLNLLGNI